MDEKTYIKRTASPTPIRVLSMQLSRGAEGKTPPSFALLTQTLHAVNIISRTDNIRPRAELPKFTLNQHGLMHAPQTGSHPYDAVAPPPNQAVDKQIPPSPAGTGGLPPPPSPQKFPLPSPRPH